MGASHGTSILALYVFLCVIVQRFSRVLDFTVLEPLAVDDFIYLCGKLAGPFESRFFASDVSEIRLLCMC